MERTGTDDSSFDSAEETLLHITVEAREILHRWPADTRHPSMAALVMVMCAAQAAPDAARAHGEEEPARQMDDVARGVIQTVLDYINGKDGIPDAFRDAFK